MAPSRGRRATARLLLRPVVSDHASRGAKPIFIRFLLVSLGINSVLGLGVVVYDMADTRYSNRQHLMHIATMAHKVARGLRAETTDSDAVVAARATQLTKAPMGLIAPDGTVTWASGAEIKQRMPTVFPEGPRRELRFRIHEDMGMLSGAWWIRPLSPRHDLLVIAIRTVDEEGIVTHMTRAAGIMGLAVGLAFAVMLVLANWMLFHPLQRLVQRLTGALQDQLAFRNNLINASVSVGIVAADGDGQIQIFNRAAQTILGFRASEVVGRMTVAELREACKSGQRTEIRTRRLSLLNPEDNEEVWVDRQGGEHLLVVNTVLIPNTPLDPAEEPDDGPPGTMLRFTDVTERRRLEQDLQQSEQQLLQSAKLATLGEMATGMAHELNQPLNNIGLLAARINMRLRRAGLSDEERTFCRDKLDKIRWQVDRAGKIIDHLRTFGRPSARRTGSVEPTALVKRVGDLLGQQLSSHGVRLEMELPDDLPRVYADETQLEQVVMNLVINARDALDELEASPPGGKRVRISGWTEPLLDGEPGVTLAVEDNGSGIPADLRPRVFEPFFTTKEVGKGTGLGLSISYGLVRDFGGAMELETHTGGDTRFVIRLRRAPDRDEDVLQPDQDREQ